VNYLALIGWAPGGGDELLPIDELARRFSLEAVGHSAGVFDEEKLAWVNRHYLKMAEPARIALLGSAGTVLGLVPVRVVARFLRVRRDASRQRLEPCEELVRGDGDGAGAGRRATHLAIAGDHRAALGGHAGQHAVGALPRAREDDAHSGHLRRASAAGAVEDHGELIAARPRGPAQQPAECPPPRLEALPLSRAELGRAADHVVAVDQPAHDAIITRCDVLGIAEAAKPLNKG